MVLTRFSTISQDDQDRYLQKLPNADNAAYNSFDKQHDGECLQNTRDGILAEIRTWADQQDQRNIFWLNGLAGTGKSTIARTVAREYDEQDRLAASFFFSRGGGDISHAGKLFPSLACQLADKSPPLKQYICEAIAKDRKIATKALRDQWLHLIIKPLSRLDPSSSSPLIIVVDALDECEDDNNVKMIIQLFAGVRSLNNVQVRIFMMSRPEVPIRHGFSRVSNSEHQDFVLPHISPQIVDHDITVFFEHQFKIIRQER